MARLYSRKKGKSGSKKPIKKSIPTWLRYNAKEVEMLVLKLAKDGKTSSEIGISLRDSYGIPNVKLVAKKTILQIMKEKKLSKELPEDVTALMRRVVAIRKHLETNKHDMTAKRGLQLTESKIKRLIKYYKKIKIIPADWKYDPTKLKMYTD